MKVVIFNVNKIKMEYQSLSLDKVGDDFMKRFPRILHAVKIQNIRTPKQFAEI